ncbi:Polyubiquitin-B [Taenia solium]|eukprot:TsM_000515600 transcript=TsM_000515600 gene=TsM_000515600
MQLRIIHRGSELLSLPVDGGTSVLQVKAAIARALGVSPEDQMLTSRGVYLEDLRSLDDYEIVESGALELHLPLKHRKFISIRVVISPEEVYSIPIRSNATVAELRAEIANRIGHQNCDVSNAFLVYSHWVLDDLRRLDDYEIVDNACVTVARTLEPEKQTSAEPYDYCEDFLEEARPPRLINVHFLREDGDPFTLTLDPSKPLKSIAKGVEEKTYIPGEHQTFIMAGRKVDVEQTPDVLNISEGESLYLSDSRVRAITPTKKRRPVNRNEMVVHFDVNKTLIPMRIPGNWTVKEVQQELQHHPMVCGRKIDLYHKNNRLESRRFLTEYGISDESVVQVKTSYL